VLNNENLSLIPISAAIGFVIGLIFIEGGISNPPIDLINTLVTGVAVLFASLGGAFYAFRLHDEKERASEIKSQIRAVNEAIFALLNNWKLVYGYRENIINPAKNNEHAWLVMGASYEGNLRREKIPLGNLSFLNNRKSVDVLFQLNIVEQLHVQWSENVIRRSHLRDDVVNKCRNVSVVEGDDNALSIEDPLEEISGTDRSKLDVMTKSIVISTDHLIDEYHKVINLFTDRMVEIYGIKEVVAIKMVMEGEEGVEN
jgi:hypothetical protein